MRVVVADDSVLFREGVARVLADQGFEVVAQAENADDLLRRVGGHKPDAVVVDIRMPPTHTDEGLRAAVEIGERHPGIGVLVLSQYLQADYAVRLLQDGSEGRGYLLKDRVADLDAFGEAVRRVANGGSVVDPEVVAMLVGQRDEHSPLDDLTPKEREILGYMAEGRTNAWICEHLVVSPRTVETHVGNIFAKLGLAETGDDHRRVLAVLTYLRAT
jgi:DNA-binding NarL/FixJ family response regulator